MLDNDRIDRAIYFKDFVVGDLAHKCFLLDSPGDIFGTHPGTDSDQPIWGNEWKDALATVHRSSHTWGGASIPSPAAIEKQVVELNRDNFTPIYIIDIKYHTPDQETKNRVKSRSTEAIRIDAADLEVRRAILGGALLKTRYHAFERIRSDHYGLTHFFLLNEFFFISNHSEAPRSVRIDFGDGAGYVEHIAGSTARVSYPSPGLKLVRLLYESNGKNCHTSFFVNILDVAIPPYTTWNLQATTSTQQTIYGQAFVFLGHGNTQLTRPILLSEGFPGNYPIEYLWSILNASNLATILLHLRFDLVIVGYADGTIDIRDNALIFQQAIVSANSQRDSQWNYQFVSGGASMGGLISRTALLQMAQAGTPSYSRTYFTLDTPHNGAYLPAGLTAASYYKDPDGEYYKMLSSPAAKQMLINTTAVGSPGWFYSSYSNAFFMGYLNALGNYPNMMLRVAVADGRGDGVDNGIPAGAVLLEWNILIANFIFRALMYDADVEVFYLRVFVDPVYQIMANLPSLDSAPGGTNGYMQTIYEMLKGPLSWGTLFYSYNCFIPTTSALGCSTLDYYCDLIEQYASGDGLSTSFQTFTFPATSLAHVYVNDNMAMWIIRELQNYNYLVLYGIGQDGNLYLSWRDLSQTWPDGVWQSWALFNSAPPPKGVAMNCNGGSGYVFAIAGATNSVSACWQQADGTWSDWADGWNGSPNDIATIYTSQGCGEFYVFAIDNSNQLHATWFNFPTGWQSGWAVWNSPPPVQALATGLAGGLLNVFALGTDGYLYWTWQQGLQGNDAWTGWDKGFMESPQLNALATGYNSGNLIVFGLDTENFVGMTAFTYEVGWSTWVSKWNNSPQLKQIICCEGSGVLHVFGLDAYGTLYMTWCNQVGVWSEWIPNFNESPAKFKTIAAGQGGGLLHLIGITTDAQAILAYRQQTGIWSGWTGNFLGAPPLESIQAGQLENPVAT